MTTATAATSKAVFIPWARNFAKDRNLSRTRFDEVIERLGIPPVEERTDADWVYFIQLLNSPYPVGCFCSIPSLQSTGVIAGIDVELGFRVNGIEGYTHPVTGYPVISQWFDPEHVVI
jgi:hypothetical protein